MSSLDKRLLEATGLPASKIAELLNKTRQAVSKGINGTSDYFKDDDLAVLNVELGKQSPYVQARFQEALGGELAERMKAATSTSGLVSAIGEAKYVWLILPDFVQSYAAQPTAYDAIFEEVNKHAPVAIAFFETQSSGFEITQKFDEKLHRQKRCAMLRIDLVATLPPMVVINPQDAPQCYVLSSSGFVAMAPYDSAGRVAALAAAISPKFERPPAKGGKATEYRRPFDIRRPDAVSVIDAMRSDQPDAQAFA